MAQSHDLLLQGLVLLLEVLVVGFGLLHLLGDLLVLLLGLRLAVALGLGVGHFVVGGFFGVGSVGGEDGVSDDVMGGGRCERARARSLFGGCWLVLGGKLGRRLLGHEVRETVTDLDDGVFALDQGLGGRFVIQSVAGMRGL